MAKFFSPIMKCASLMRGSQAVGEIVDHDSYSLLLNFKMLCMIKVFGVSSESQG